MTCPKCTGLVIQQRDTSYEPVYFHCLICGWAGRIFERVPDHLCAQPGCQALLEPGFALCMRHRYEVEVGLMGGPWSADAKAKLRAKRGKTLHVPFNPILIKNGERWKEEALKALILELESLESRKASLLQTKANLEGL